MGGSDEEGTMQGTGAGEEERILVSVRMRPLNEEEISRNEEVDWECINDATIVYKNHLSPERTMYPTSYTFDRVFRRDCSTRQVYEEGAKSIVLSAVSGINSSVFAYGQTSSGKTFTMSGITEYTMEDIFDHIQKKNKEREFQLKFSAMEIYNESVRDLLATDNSPLRLLDDPERGTVVEKLTEETLRDWNHFRELLAVCEAQRQIGETYLNEASSRSHQILRLTIESSTREYLGKNNSSTVAATLHFVDLAGSERASQALSAGTRMKEGSHINRSLLTLGTVIRKLSKGRTGHIPFRDSKLTRILQCSLGGNARTAIICTMSPARSYVEQSRNTLLFASCAKEVKTNAQVNVVMSDKALVKHLQRELAKLENELRSASPSVRSDANYLLREKDSKIEELERCLRELTLRLDLALSQIHDLQQGAEQRSPSTWEGEDSYRPELNIRQGSGSFSSEANTVTYHPSFRTTSPLMRGPQSPDRRSSLSYDENYSGSDSEENLPSSSSPFKQVFIETPCQATSTILIHPGATVVGLDCQQEATNLSEVDPYMVSEKNEQNSTLHESESFKMYDEIGDQIPANNEINDQQFSDEIGEKTCYSFGIDDQCQVFGKIPEETFKYDNADSLQTSEAIWKHSDDHLEHNCKEVQCIEFGLTDARTNSLPLEEEDSLLLMGDRKIRYNDDGLKQETRNKTGNSLLDSTEKSGKHKIDDVVELESSNCLDSRSGQSNDMNSISSSFVEKLKREMRNECEKGSEKSAVDLQDIQRKLSALKSEVDIEVSRISKGDADFDEIHMSNVTDSSHVGCTENLTSSEMTHCVKHVSNHQLNETEDKAEKFKNMKDVGFNPQDDLDTTSPLISDFKRLQEEIIDLWDACNVSLVHRTCFFLLFINSDPKDSVYMEVERRRLVFIKDAFSWGDAVVLDGRELTPGSSKRSVHTEREMLGKLMKRRLSSQERKDMYVKWGIRLDTKRRSLQLAHRLWMNTIDMEHITESAKIVAKLVRFKEPQISKEAVGLNLVTSLGHRKLFRWKQNRKLIK